MLLLADLDDAGPRPDDPVEHAALMPVDLVADLARRRLRVVTQPGFLADRGDDYLREVPAAEHPDLYRCASRATAGIPLALSTDAPYGPGDPWTAIAAASDRRTPGGQVLGATERLAPEVALDAFLTDPGDLGGPPKRVRPGAAADLVLLHAPLREVLTRPSAAAVHAVLRAGRPVPA